MVCSPSPQDGDSTPSAQTETGSFIYSSIQSFIHSLKSNRQLTIGHLRGYHSEHVTRMSCFTIQRKIFFYMVLYRGTFNFCQMSDFFELNAISDLPTRGYMASPKSHDENSRYPILKVKPKPKCICKCPTPFFNYS